MPEILKGMESFFGRGRFEIKPFADGVCCYIGCFGNVGVVETDEGLILFDLAIRQFGRYVFNAVRNFSDKPVKYIIYSHGHFDHCFGYAPFIKEIKKKGWEMPQIIAHENLLKRFAKYRMLEKHQAWSYRQQFASVGVGQSDRLSIQERLDPTLIIRNEEGFEFTLGKYTFQIYHDKGETDDSIWMYFPEKKVLFTGDLFVSSFPNVGSPFRVQRYAKDWALANEKMIEKNAEYLLPGHGRLIEGKDKIREVLSITAESMHFVHDEVVKRLNEGKWFEEIYHEMLEIFPEKFKNHRYLKPQYGDYRFAIYDVYRLYHGWYDSGNPTDLFPAKSDEVAKEFLKVADGEKFLDRANQLVEEGKPQLALHVLDVIIKADDKAHPDTFLNALKLKHKIVKEKAKEEESFIAKNILNTSALQINTKLKDLDKKPK